jgi:hypothetical protein
VKITKYASVLISLVVLASTSFAQSVETRPQGVLGFLDPGTGIFRTVPVSLVDASEAPALAAASTGGKFVFNFTINVAATISATAKIGCIATATVTEAATLNFITEQAGALATRSGSTATCTVNIPYSWTLNSASTDTVSLTYSIQAPAEAAVSASFPNRTSTHSLPSIKVPANGATTTETITATI